MYIVTIYNIRILNVISYDNISKKYVAINKN